MSNHRNSKTKRSARSWIGGCVAEVSERLGVSAHSLHKWVKAVKPDKSEEQADELNSAKQRLISRYFQDHLRILPMRCPCWTETAAMRPFSNISSTVEPP